MPYLNQHLYLPLVCLLTLSSLSITYAHHPTSNYGLQAAAPQNSLEIDSQFAAYPKAIDGYGGHWWLTNIRTEYRVLRPFSVAVNIPYALIKTQQGKTKHGISDLELSFKYSLYRNTSTQTHFSGGVAFEMPTGNQSLGLGNGHFECSPFISAHKSLGDHWLIFTNLSVQFALEFDDHHHEDADHHSSDEHDSDHDHHSPQDSFYSTHSSVIAPHGSYELNSLLGVAYRGRLGYVTGRWQWVQSLTNRDRNVHNLGVEFGYLHQKKWRLATGLDLPVSDQSRFDYRTRLAWAYFW